MPEWLRACDNSVAALGRKLIYPLKQQNRRARLTRDEAMNGPKFLRTSYWRPPDMVHLSGSVVAVV
jgi:hypothetical protein